MKIRELILKLEFLLAEAGDLPIAFVSDEDEHFRIDFPDTIEKIEIPGLSVCGLISKDLASDIEELKKPALRIV